MCSRPPLTGCWAAGLELDVGEASERIDEGNNGGKWVPHSRNG